MATIPSVRGDGRVAVPLQVVAALLLLLSVALTLPRAAQAQSPDPSAISSPAASPSVPASAAGSPATSPSAAASAVAVAGASQSAAPCPNRPPVAATPGPSGASPAPTAHPNLCPAEAKADPFSLLAWLFTPVFQVLFLGLVGFYRLFGDIGLAIIALTIVIRFMIFPLFRRQIVSQRRMQLLQPELKAIQQKHRGDRARISEEQMRLYKERGANPVAGCLPTLLQFVFLVPMYSVFSSGLSAPDISSMLHVLGQRIIDVPCVNAGDALRPCIDTTVRWLGGLDASKPEILFLVPATAFGVSAIAVLSALLQVIQTRMMAPPTDDPQARTQQRAFLILPFMSVIYGSFLPAGLFIYWIVTTVFSIVQQYLIAGWGSLFPLFGWNPSFAANHSPRFAIAPPPMAGGSNGSQKSRTGPSTTTVVRRSPADRAAGTVKPARNKGRGNRRGRRR